MTRISTICLVAIAISALTADVSAQQNEVSVQRALDKPILLDLAITDAPIHDVFSRISSTTGVKFIIDEDTLKCLPYGDQTRLTVTLKNVTLRNALTPMLSPQALRWEIDKNAVRIVPSEPLYRMCRRASFEELSVLGKLHTARLTPAANKQALLKQLTKATGNDKLNVFFHVPIEEEADLGRANQIAPTTAVRWLDMLTHGKGWTWFLKGNDIVVIDRKMQIGRQLKQRTTLSYENEKLITVLLDLAKAARVKLAMEPGVMSYLPAQSQNNFNIMMVDATVDQALEVISGATGLEFVNTGKDIRVEASEELRTRGWQRDGTTRRRAPFFVKMSIPGPDSTTMEVFLRADELPEDVVEKIKAEKEKLIEGLRKQEQ